MATRISAALVAVALALFAPFAQAQQPFTVPSINVLHGGTLNGTFGGTPTYSGSTIFNGALTLGGLDSGSQVSCLGLTSSNDVVAQSGACGSGGGGGSGTVQNGTTGQIPAYNATGNTVGPLTGALALPGALTLNVGTLPTTNAGEIITGNALNSGGYTAAAIYGMSCPGCTGFVDGLQSIGTVAPGFTGAQQTGFASYFVDNAATSGGLHNAVGFFAAGVAAANNAAIWGFNTLLTDNTSQTVSAGTGKILFNELDFNATSPNTTIEGIALSGASLVQPASANGITCHALGTGIQWNGCLISQDGHVQNAMYVGLSGATSGNNLSSQPILFENTDGSGNRVTLVLRALTGNILSDSGGLVVTGSTSVPTPSQFDSSTNAATTAFVHAAGLQVAGQVVISSNTTLTASQAGNFVAITAIGATVTLPAANTVPRGNGYAIHNESAGTAFLAAHAGDTIPDAALISDANTVLLSDGVSTWLPVVFSLGNNGGGGGGNWTAAPVGSVSGGLSITSGVLTDQWSAGQVTALSGLSIVGTTLTVTGGGGSPPGGTVGQFQINLDGTNFGGVTFTGDMTSDTSGNTSVVSLGSAAALVGNANGQVLATNVTPVADGAYAIQVTDEVLVPTSLTAARTWTLPLAASVPKGWPITINDANRAINATDTLTLATQSADLINNGASITLNGTNDALTVISGGPGTTVWSIQVGPGIAPVAPVSHEFMTGLNAFGVFSLLQPAFTDISGQASLAQLPTITGPGLLGALTTGVPISLTLGSHCSITVAVFDCSGGGSGSPGGSSSDVQYNSSSSFGGNGGFTYDGTSVVALGVSGTSVGSVQLNNATSGSIKLSPTTGALGSSVASFPANTGVVAETNLAQTFTATQTYNNSTIAVLGSSTGTTTITSANASSTPYTLTVPANTGTVAELNLAQTFTATQTFGTIGGYLANVATQTGTTYTLASTDCGTLILFNNASAVTVTLPNNLSVGCEISAEQDGAGQVTFSPASGATLQSFDSYTKTAGQNAMIGLALKKNSGGSSAIYVMTGRGA